MKKRGIVIAAVLLLVSLCTTLIILIWKKNTTDNPGESADMIEGTPEWSYRVVREAKEDILVIGEDPCFEFDMPYRRESEITEETLRVRDGFNSLVILLIDRNGNVKLSKEEIALIDSFIYEQKGSLIYIGEQYGSAWDHEGEGGSYNMAVGNRAIAYTYEKGMLIKSINFWTQEHEEIFKSQPEILGQSIVNLLEMTIIKNS